MKPGAIAVLIAAGVVRLIIAALTPPFPDETYYWDRRPNQYDLWPSFRDRASTGDALVFVDNDQGDRANPAVVALSPHFAEVDSGRAVSLKRRGDVVKDLRFWTFTGWRGTWPTPTVRSQP